jgi:hypothetical protein
LHFEHVLDVHVIQAAEQEVTQAELLKVYPVAQTVQAVSDVQVVHPDEQGEHPPDELI